jgi:hypothetical protein
MIQIRLTILFRRQVLTKTSGTKLVLSFLNRPNSASLRDGHTGISRISFHMDVAELPQAKHLRSIELVGSRVALALQQQALTFG